MTMIQHGAGISKFSSFCGGECSGSGLLGWAHMRLCLPSPVSEWPYSYHTPFNPEDEGSILLQNIGINLQ
jgi:hypothetical protein